jgi:acetyltransferase-like isoleucine patch superfamily enzyme
MFLKNFAWVFLTLWGLVKYLPMPFGNIFRHGVLKLFLKRIGKRSWVRDGVTFWYPKNISIGDHSSINEFVYLNGAGGIEIGDYVMIAHNASLISEDHGFDDVNTVMRKQASIRAKITIGSDVWIGAGVHILKGVTIGEGALIGANAVVTKDIPPYAIAVGNPARVLRYRGQEAESHSTQKPEPVLTEKDALTIASS